jgi:hypothetical protein
MRKPKYNLDYFIRKFEAIPEDQWCTGDFVKVVNGKEQRCAFGHCGYRYGPADGLGFVEVIRTAEGGALEFLVRTSALTSINDGMNPVELSRNNDGTWTARVFSQCFSGTYEECVRWLRMNGEAAT